VLYYTKGSGGNGINTVYFVDSTGTVCHDAIAGVQAANGVGLPVPGASLPTSGLAYDPTVVQTTGLPNNMCILKGFPTLLANSRTGVSYPFGIWFANATTLYVADEGNGNHGSTVATFYTPAATQNPTAGLQKWVFESGQWKLAYILTKGLGLGIPYSVPNSPNGQTYPTGNNDGAGGTNFPWAPAPDGLRNLTGVVNDDGTVTIYAITSTISGSGDQGADPNQLVAITDTLSAGGPNPPSGESFTILKIAAYGEVLRGVSWAPGTQVAGH